MAFKEILDQVKVLSAHLSALEEDSALDNINLSPEDRTKIKLYLDGALILLQEVDKLVKIQLTPPTSDR